jgi:CheY-like chemotaxis protein
MSTKVLLIEDDLTFQADLNEDLQALCFTVHTAEEAGRALELAQINRYDLLITDIRIAGKDDGISALQRIRQTPGHHEIPCIVITGFSNNEVVHRALQTHIQAYLTKPFGLQALYNTVNNCLQANRDKTEIQGAVQKLMRWLRLDPKSQEERRELEKAPYKKQIEADRRYLYSIFCSGLQMNTVVQEKRQERFLLISTATDLWWALRPLEVGYFRFNSLPLEPARQLASNYQILLQRAKRAIETGQSGTGVYPKDQHPGKEIFLRFIRRIESCQITPEETAYGWLLWELKPEVREKNLYLSGLYELLWGETPPKQRGWKGADEIMRQAEELS